MDEEDEINSIENPDFKYLVSIYARSSECQDMWRKYGESYLLAFFILNSEYVVLDDTHDTYDVTTVRNSDTTKIATYCRFTTTTLDLSMDTVQETIENKKY